jgi:hypothetical protein
MSLTTINVEVPHTLGVELAAERLGKEKGGWLTRPTKITVEFEAGAFGIVGATGRVVITKDSATFETDQGVGPLEKWAEERARAWLKEKLK